LETVGVFILETVGVFIMTLIKKLYF